jgi:hypothetical protein
VGGGGQVFPPAGLPSQVAVAASDREADGALDGKQQAAEKPVGLSTQLSIAAPGNCEQTLVAPAQVGTSHAALVPVPSVAGPPLPLPLRRSRRSPGVSVQVNPFAPSRRSCPPSR